MPDGPQLIGKVVAEQSRLPSRLAVRDRHVYRVRRGLPRVTGKGELQAMLHRGWSSVPVPTPMVFNKARYRVWRRIPECLALCSRVIVLSGVEHKEDTARAFLRRVNEIFEGEALAVSRVKFSTVTMADINMREYIDCRSASPFVQNVVRFKICDPLYSIRSLKRKLALVLLLNVVRTVDFGHVALHKLFGVKDSE
ncbi:hypothetical protein HPB51_008241 [Rhipicephalus microplus]|uniref:Uncharacterized protein n=1 Tax=Rhipicephalus microplus TaxID=6941 RepID=A0A9J6F0A2_RHIMP|nr:hypothetical protein HPB51_008241 [Rhipicephalus microplus]